MKKLLVIIILLFSTMTMGSLSELVHDSPPHRGPELHHWGTSDNDSDSDSDNDNDNDNEAGNQETTWGMIKYM